MHQKETLREQCNIRVAQHACHAHWELLVHPQWDYAYEKQHETNRSM
ncbi:hypothetical protein OESDEN_06466 [Oesophagostomum dentatum]|uniref:Uncharacterized protein n=1 Tax=Oesophagostomum dentatum TaxID=61180 RepID=A0A0B1T7V2_OESDE|nr:hypothetical protein OESDEN_06466 [Oesophagostomum dentatum]